MGEQPVVRQDWRVSYPPAPAVRLRTGVIAALVVGVLGIGSDTALGAHRSCGTMRLPTAGLVSLSAQGVSCAGARLVARRYDTGLAPRPWNCGLARQGDPGRVLFSCGWGGRGDYR